MENKIRKFKYFIHTLSPEIQFQTFPDFAVKPVDSWIILGINQTNESLSNFPMHR